MKLSKLALSILCVVLLFSILAGFYDYSFNSQISLLGFDKDPRNPNERRIPILHIALAGIGMLLGIVSGSLHSQLQGKEIAPRPKELLNEMLTGGHFFRSILASPLLFAGVYLAAKTQPDLIVAFLFSFENGFFCNTMLSKKRESIAPRNT